MANTPSGLTTVEKIASRYAVGLKPVGGAGGAAPVVRCGDFASIRPKHVMMHDNTGAVM